MRADLKYEPLPSVFPGPKAPWAPPILGGARIQPREVGPPHGPPNLDLVSFTSKFTSIFTDITSKSGDILGIGLHVNWLL